jgi:hypothetical protein
LRTVGQHQQGARGQPCHRRTNDDNVIDISRRGRLSPTTSTDAMSLPSVDLSEAAPAMEEADRRPVDTAGLLSCLVVCSSVTGSRERFD